MKLSVIGGSGFIGTRLCRRLSQAGDDFEIVDILPRGPYLDCTQQADVRNFQSLSPAVSGQTIVHLAAVHRDDVRPVSLYDEVNVEGARNVCRVAREKSIEKIVFTSSVAVYGFAPPNTDETGRINPSNDYGRTKWAAEKIFMQWQNEDPVNRTLVIIRPTVVFGEGNRGNVYNLLRQIARRRFMMIGDGNNYKSMAYVENVAAFIQHCLGLGAGVHTYNYVDKPDMCMAELVSFCRRILKQGDGTGVRWPVWLGMAAGRGADLLARVSGRSFPVSALRVHKFLATTRFETAVARTDFVPPVDLADGLKATLRYEFLEDHADQPVFVTE